MMERIVWSAIGLRKAFEFIMTRRTTMDYRNKYLHASVCESGNGCSRSCTKWKLFITVLLELSYCVIFRVAGFAMMKTKSMVCI